MRESHSHSLQVQSPFFSQLPFGWDARPLKYFGLLRGGSGFPDQYQGVQFAEIPFFKVKALERSKKSLRIEQADDTITRKTATELCATIFPKNSIVFAKVGAALMLGRYRFLDQPSCIDNNMMAFVPRTNCICPRFAFYVLGLLDLSYIVNPGAVPSINAAQVGSQIIPIAPRQLQSAIADFLDRETAQADALVEKYERLIELLEERRVALITQAVTKGLNPDGPMKDSGVEWLGDIPKSWNIIPFRYCGTISEGQVDPTDVAFRDLILIAPNHVKSGTGKLLYTETAAEQGAMSGKYRVRAGDVVYSKIRPALNKVTIAPSDCLCSADMYPIRASKRIDAKFLLYSMLAQPFANLTTEVSMRVAMPKINRETLASIPMAIPTIATQRDIVAHVESTTCEIDKTIAEVIRALTLVREHRSALITAAVTGQIDVSTYRIKKQQTEVPA